MEHLTEEFAVFSLQFVEVGGEQEGGIFRGKGVAAFRQAEAAEHEDGGGGGGRGGARRGGGLGGRRCPGRGGAGGRCTAGEGLPHGQFAPSGLIEALEVGAEGGEEATKGGHGGGLRRRWRYSW